MQISASQAQIEGWLRTPGFGLGSNQFTYSVTTAQSVWPGYGAGSEPVDPAYSYADPALASGFRAAIAMWDSIIAPDFTELADNGSQRGEVRIAYTDTDSSLGYAYSTTPTAPGGLAGDIWMSSSKKGESWNSGTSLFEGLLHEIGHTLGLKHTFDAPTVPTALDDTRYSIMSYTHAGVFWSFSQTGNMLTSIGAYPSALTPMVLDIAAAHAIYGPETTTRTGNNVYTFKQWEAVLQTLYDAGGIDTIDTSTFTLPSLIDLRPGAYSSIGMASAAAQIAYWSAQFPGFTSFITSVVNGEKDLFTFTDNLGIALGTVIENAIGGAGADTLTGNDTVNRLTGGLGNDTIDGGSNVDTAVVAGNRSAYTVTQTSTPGKFTVTGPDGTDTLTNVEYLQFADQKIRLYPGSGTSVDFSASPSTYMAAIRDFDGNDVGAAADWKRIGSADVNGDGDLDQIYVNRTNGRFAEVATAPDGKVYFGDHGWAGETRVVGIYIDPLVQAGQVQAGGLNDSQRRFQNDLNIGNIKGVLGSGDYDKDGLQEVYFALTDGTAFLHAYMHADGNIRYANYQSQQQVIGFLSQNGWASSTYDGWFA